MADEGPGDTRMARSMDATRCAAVTVPGYFPFRSLAGKLLLVALLCGGVVGAAALGVLLVDRREALVADLDGVVAGVGRAAADALAEPLWMFRTDVIEGILAGVLADSRILCVRQIDLVTGRRMERPDPGCFGDAAPDRVAGFDVMRGGRTIARLDIGYSAVDVDLRVADEAARFGAVLLATLAALGSALGVTLHLLVARPLRRLHALLERADAAGDAGEGGRPAGDEIAVLIARCTRMIRNARKSSQDIVAAADRADRATAAMERALDEVETAKRLLIDAGRLAALGRLALVGARALDTPLGDAVAGMNRLSGALRTMRQQAAEGNIRRSDFDAFMAAGEESAGLVRRDLERVAARVQGIRRIAADGSGDVRRHFDARTCLEEVVAAILPRFEGRIAVSVEGESGIALDSDPGSLAQVVTGLIENAAAHAFDSSGRGTVVVALGRPVPGAVRITVRDDGRGIPPGIVGRVFEPFFTTRPDRGDSGLGLHIAERVVTGALGGRIGIHSAEGQGTTVILDLPIWGPHGGPAAAVPS